MSTTAVARANAMVVWLLGNDQLSGPGHRGSTTSSTQGARLREQALEHLVRGVRHDDRGACHEDEEHTGEIRAAEAPCGEEEPSGEHIQQDVGQSVRQVEPA